MWAFVLASALVTAPPTTAENKDRSTLFMPIEATSGVQPNLALALSDALVAEAARVLKHKVVAFRDVESAMSAEQVRQAVNCDSTSCAAEIAGALNVDEIVNGRLVRLGATYQLALTRVAARTAAAPKRFTGLFPVAAEEQLVLRAPAIIAELFELGAGPALVTTESKAPGRRPVLPWTLRGAAAVAAGVALLPLVGAGVCATIVVAVFITNGMSFEPSTRIFPLYGLASNISVVVAPILLLVTAALGVVAAGLLGGSFVVP